MAASRAQRDSGVRILSGGARAACLAFALAACSSSGGESQAPAAPAPPSYLLDVPWQPAAPYTDVAYVQEVATHFTPASSVLSEPMLRVRVGDDGRVFFASANGVWERSGGGFEEVGPALTEPIVDLEVAATGLLVATGSSVAVSDGATWAAYPTGGPTIADAATCPDVAYLATSEGVFALDLGTGQLGPAPGLPAAPARAVATDCEGTVFARLETSVAVAAPDGAAELSVPGDAVALAFDGAGAALVAVPGGVSRVGRAASGWAFEPLLTAEEGLPSDATTAIAFGRRGELLLGFARGAARLHDDDWHYYNSQVWMPGLAVADVTSEADGTVWLATDGGVAAIAQTSLTLGEKAAAFDALTATRHVRLGYVSTECALAVPGDATTCTPHDDDNDGEWTALYVASQSFRYAATGDEEARDNASRSLRALLELERVTGVSGFFARSIVPGDECEAKQGGGGEWHLSEDGQSCWKGNTSSDEWVGHFFALPLYHDLVADDDERAEIAGAMGRMLDHLVEGGLCIRDVDGECTSDGHFEPTFINTVGLFGDAGLNGAMVLGALRAGLHVTGEAKYQATFETLAEGEGYAEHVGRIQEINTLTHINHDSEEMSFLALYSLMRYEDDPARMAIWKRGLEGLWETQRRERNPEFNFLYAALSHDDDSALDDSIGTLQALPMDLVDWEVRNSHRLDVTIDPEPDRFGELQSTVVLPYDERRAVRWAENPYRLDVPGEGRAESSGTFWLLPYWMGRYLGLIR